MRQSHSPEDEELELLAVSAEDTDFTRTASGALHNGEFEPRNRHVSEEEHVALTTEDELLSHFNATHEEESILSSIDVFRDDVKSLRRFVKRKCSGMTNTKGPSTPFPAVQAARGYKRENLMFDVPAGLVEGVMEVPMGLAYSQLSNMPLEYGLYTCLVPPLVYMLMGSSAQLSIGVAAIECVMLAESVRGVIGAGVADADDDATMAITTQYTLFFTLMVGLWQLGFRMLNLQSLSALLSEPVMSGFATGGALIVATTQLSALLGVKLPTTDMVPGLWLLALQQVRQWNWVVVTVGCCSMAFLVALQAVNKRYFPKVPVPWQLPLVVLATLVSQQLDLHNSYGLVIVGAVPAGLPRLHFPAMPAVPGVQSVLRASLLPTCAIALFNYVMSLSLAKVFARKSGGAIDSGRELLAIGAANVVGSNFGAFVIAGSFSRTAVVHAIGAKTVFHGAASVFVVFLGLTTITSLLHHLPKCVLSAIVLVGVVKVPEFHEMMRFYRIHKVEFLIWQVTFWVCITAGAIRGIAAGVLASLMFITVRYTSGKTVRLGRLPGTALYRNIERFPMAKEVEGVIVLRFDGNLNFANQERFVASLQSAAGCRRFAAVVIDASSINDIDVSSMQGIVHLVEDFTDRGLLLYFAGWKGPQREMLERAGFYQKIKRETMFLDLHDAVKRARLHVVGRQDPDLRKEISDAVTQALHETVVKVLPDGHEHAWAVAYPDDALRTRRSESRVPG